jgi:pyruvate dehydrogenase phosphatase
MLDIFTRDHNSFFRSKSKGWKENAEIVKSGSTALVLDIDRKERSAVVSNAGDCRLVICRAPSASHRPADEREDSQASHRAIATVIWETTDLNAKLPTEQERLSSEHPGEDMIVVGGRLFGKLMTTRGTLLLSLFSPSISLSRKANLEQPRLRGRTLQTSYRQPQKVHQRPLLYRTLLQSPS